MTDDFWLHCCQMPGPLHADMCVNRQRARTIDNVPVIQGLRVIDYNLDTGSVHSVNHVTAQGVAWFDITLDKGGRSTMDGGRLWTRLATNSGTMVAAAPCDCNDVNCSCDCRIGNYLCEHGSAGEGC